MVEKIQAVEKKKVRPPSVFIPILNRLIDHEGFSLDPYLDSRRNLTGGIGHKMTKRDVKDFDYNWTDDQKYDYWISHYDRDYTKAKRDVNELIIDRNIPTENNKNVENVLVDMSFNMGIARVRRFRNFLRALEDEDYEEAVVEMKMNSDRTDKSDWYKQTSKRVDSLAEELTNKE